MNGGKTMWAIIGGVVAATLAITAFFVFRTPPPADVPTGYAKFVSGDKLWGFDAPQGWNRSATGAASEDDKSIGMNAVVCSSSSAKVDISISTVAGLISNQLLFGNAPTPEAMGGSHANGIQNSTLKPFKKGFRGYQETEVTEKLPWKMGQMMIKGFSLNGVTVPDIKEEPDVRLAEYTAKSNNYGLGGPVHGYRASLGGETLIAFAICQCSERDWPRLKPEFQHMLASIYETPKAVKTISSQPNTGMPNLMSPIGGL